MEKLMVVHHGHEHPLQLVMQSESDDAAPTCHQCKQPLLSQLDCYGCLEVGCEYYLHKECGELDYMHHPLHPQHPLVSRNSNIPNDKSELVCSFCGGTCTPGFFERCDQCDFFLHSYCTTEFLVYDEDIHKYEIQHFLHDHENHHLIPYSIPWEIVGLERTGPCNGCGLETHNTPIFKCTECPFYLHVPCFQVPKEIQSHFHPKHILTLLPKPPAEFEELCCLVCRKMMDDTFVLHCTECPINLHLRCSFFKPTLKPERHEHPLMHCEKIGFDDVRCSACNTLCKSNSYRCFDCNFNIHSQCLSLPLTVNYDDHVHPLTLISSFREDDSNNYYCDICEERRDPDHGVYYCKECLSFVAHFECVLSMKSTTQLEASSSKQLENESSTSTQEEEVVSEKYTIFLQWDAEIEKLREVVKKLSIKEMVGKQLTEKLEELEETHENAEGMLRRLKQSFKETN